MHDGGAGVQREMSEGGLSLCLETVQMRRIGIVQLETEGRHCGKTDNDLEIFVDVIEGIDLRTQATVKGSCLVSHFVVRQFLRTKCRRGSQTDGNVQATGPKSG